MKNRITMVFITLMLVSFTLACTLTEPVEKIVYIEITSTPEDVADGADVSVSVTDEVVASTPTVSVNLDGPWTIWQGTAGQHLMIDFLQQGYDLIANAATGDGHSILFKGVISHDGTDVTGVWESTTGTSGNFIMSLDQSLSSFSGNLGGGVPFCGTRMGTTKPNPCLK
jgi:hypothetical protein